MTILEDSPIVTKQPSDELLKLIEDLKINLVKAKDLFVLIVNKARDEGFEDNEIDILLYSKLKEIIPKTTLLRYRKEFIPLAINKRDNASNENLNKDNIEQSSITSSPNGPIDKTSTNHNLTPITNHRLQPIKKELESTIDNYENSLNTTDEVVHQQNDNDNDIPLTPLPQIDSNSLQNDIKKIQDAKPWSYESEEEFEKRKQFATQILDDMTPEEFQKIKESPLELENLQLKLQIRADAYYRSQYEDRLEQFFTKWQEMKKLYLELIELYCKDNSSNRIWLKDAIICIQEDLKSYHNFSFTEKLSDYVTEHFIDKKYKNI